MNQRWKPAAMSVIALALILTVVNHAPAPPIPPSVIKAQFEKTSMTAEVVVKVRVLGAVCIDSSGDAVVRVVHLQLALEVLEVSKGPMRKHDLLVVRHQVTLRGPGAVAPYHYLNDCHSFPFIPGVKGDVALRWDAELRQYQGVSGWVAEPNFTDRPPIVPGQAFALGDPPPAKK